LLFVLAEYASLVLLEDIHEVGLVDLESIVLLLVAALALLQLFILYRLDQYLLS
jgi:hypothetical protein